jgi:hypothetical protein
MRTNVYVDAFNLAALCRRLLPNDEVNQIRYFTALVSARPDDPQEPQRPANHPQI